MFSSNSFSFDFVRSHTNTLYNYSELHTRTLILSARRKQANWNFKVIREGKTRCAALQHRKKTDVVVKKFREGN